MNKNCSNYYFTMNGRLFRFLHEDNSIGGNRLCKYDAFVSLLERATIVPKSTTVFGMKILLTRGQCVTSYSELAGKWKWHRNNVRTFLLSLAEMDVLTVERRGKATVITLPVMTDNSQEPKRLLSTEERNWLHFIFGIISIEEFINLLDAAMSEVENEIGVIDGQNSNDEEIGYRLQRLTNHLLIQTTGLFPYDKKLSEAMRSLFIDECDADLVRFFTLLIAGGLKLFSDAEDETKPKYSIPAGISSRLAIILDYYSSFAGNSLKNGKQELTADNGERSPA